MRTDKSIKNAIISLFSNGLTIIMGFIAQLIFVKYLNKEYLGLNGLFSNIISMLGIVELGLGTALVYHLYKPIANKDIPKIKILMKFYKKSYYIIAIIVLILGVLLMPFLKMFVTTTLPINVYIVFSLFLLETVSSYLLSYKRSILYANQENYIVNIIKIIYVLGLNITQIVALIKTQNYIIFLTLKILFRIIENIITTLIADKRYPFLKEKVSEKLDGETKNDIFKKIKGLFMHKIGAYIVLGTDNILISKFLGLITVGIYSNYALIITGIKSIFSQMFYSITAGVGNLLVENNKKRSYIVYCNMLFINFWLACCCCISFYVIEKTFITIWLGSDFVLNKRIVFAIMIQLYLDIFGYTIGAFKSGKGIFHEDRWMPIVQAIINIIVSVVLGKIIGLIGIVIGTIASYLLLYFYSYPKYVYKKIFEKSYKDYYREFLKYFIIFICLLLITDCMANLLSSTNKYILLLSKGFMCLTIPNILIMLIFWSKDEFKYCISLIKKLFKTLQTKIKRI